jgi:predicted transcriptional regulator
MQCKICNKEFDKLESLFRHLMKKHSLSSQSVYNEYTLNNNIPTCKCGDCHKELHPSYNT